MNRYENIQEFEAICDISKNLYYIILWKRILLKEIDTLVLGYLNKSYNL